MIAKDEEFVGSVLPLPIIDGTGGGRSSTFANAQGNQKSVEPVSFMLTRKKDYGVARITNELMKASKSNKGAFLNAAKGIIDPKIQQVSNSIEIMLIVDGIPTAEVPQMERSG